MKLKDALLYSFLMTSTIVAIPSLQAAEPPSLRDELKPLAPMLGNWTMSWTTPDGKNLSGTASVTIEAGGAAILFRADAPGKDGRPGFTRLSVFHWQPETQTLAERHFGAGGYGMNLLVQQTSTRFIWQGHGFGRNGKPGMGTTVVALENGDSWSAKFDKVVHAGEALPDSPPITFTRTK